MSRCRLCGGEIQDRSDSRYCVYCNSTFHRECITDHFYQNKYCPVCNRKMSLIFMRIGEPPEPISKKREVPLEIRRPKWPQLEERTEIPVFSMDIPSGPLKRTDKYIPKAKGKREFPGLPRKRGKVKIPVKAVAAVIVIAVVAVGGYYGLTRANISLPFSSPGEKPPESPWKTVWTYPLEGVTDIAASDTGIVIGGKNGLVVLDSNSTVIWEKEGDITDVDISNDIVVASNRGTIEVYSISGSEIARYGEGTALSVSLSEYGILMVGLTDGGVVLLDYTGTVLDSYETGGVGAVSISPDAAALAYREGSTVYVLGILGDVLYAFEDEGSSDDRIIVLPSQQIFARRGSEVFLYDGQEVLWSVDAGCTTAGLAVSDDGEQFAVNGDTAGLYDKNGGSLYTLPVGSCGGVAFSGEDVIVSDPGNVYYLRLEEVPETEAPEREPEEEEEEGEGEEPEEEEGEPEEGVEIGTFEDWWSWYEQFLSVPGNSAEYEFTFEEEGEITQEMRILYTIDSIEGGSTIETVVMTYQAGDTESQTSFKRWINPEGECLKAEMTIDSNVSDMDCSKTNIRGIDFRKLLTYNWEYVGQEEITVERGTFTCHKVQVTTENGVITLWVTQGLPPVRISITLESGAVATMELV